mgnify:CR=1 FL=1
MTPDRKYISETLPQSDLSGRLNLWFRKNDAGVYLFREGSTISEFSRSRVPGHFAEAELGELWLVRMFCHRYELFARRLNYHGGQEWQMRIVAIPNMMTDGENARFLGPESTILWGEATGEGNSFVTKPNRFRRTKLEYPNAEGWSKWERCKLLAERFQPAEGESIVCWTELKPTKTQNTATQSEQLK